MVQKILFILIVVTIAGCRPHVTDFSGSLIYEQTFKVINDSIPDNISEHYEKRYEETVEICVLVDGKIEKEYTTGYLGLDFMANISDLKRSSNGYKGIDTLLVPQKNTLHNNFQTIHEERVFTLKGKEGIMGDSSYNYPYIIKYSTVKDSLFYFRDINFGYRDFYFATILKIAKQLPITYSIETKDFIVTRKLVDAYPSDSSKTIRLTRKLRKTIP